MRPKYYNAEKANYMQNRIHADVGTPTALYSSTGFEVPVTIHGKTAPLHRARVALGPRYEDLVQDAHGFKFFASSHKPSMIPTNIDVFVKHVEAEHSDKEVDIAAVSLERAMTWSGFYLRDAVDAGDVTVTPEDALVMGMAEYGLSSPGVADVDAFRNRYLEGLFFSSAQLAKWGAGEKPALTDSATD